MKKIVIFIVFCSIVLFTIIGLFRANKLSKEFDSLTNNDFTTFGLVINGTDYIWGKGTKEYDVIKSTLFNLLRSLQAGAPNLMRGESKIAGDVIAGIDKRRYYLLSFGYAPELDIISIQIFNKNNFSITKHFFIDKKIASGFFSNLEATASK
jgi:hypothetical protein